MVITQSVSVTVRDNIDCILSQSFKFFDQPFRTVRMIILCTGIPGDLLQQVLIITPAKADCINLDSPFDRCLCIFVIITALSVGQQDHQLHSCFFIFHIPK